MDLPRLAGVGLRPRRLRPVSSPDTVCPPMPNTPCCARSVSTARFTLPCQQPTMRPMPRPSRTIFASSSKPMPGARSQPSATQATRAGVATHLTNTFCIPAMLPSTSWSRASLDWEPKPVQSCFNSRPSMCEPWVDHSTLPCVYTLFWRPCRMGRCTRSSCAITSSYLRPIVRC